MYKSTRPGLTNNYPRTARFDSLALLAFNSAYRLLLSSVDHHLRRTAVKHDSTTKRLYRAAVLSRQWQPNSSKSLLKPSRMRRSRM